MPPSGHHLLNSFEFRIFSLLLIKDEGAYYLLGIVLDVMLIYLNSLSNLTSKTTLEGGNNYAYFAE